MEKKLAVCLAIILPSLGSVLAQSDYVKAVGKWRSDGETDGDSPWEPDVLFDQARRSLRHSAERQPEQGATGVQRPELVSGQRKLPRARPARSPSGAKGTDRSECARRSLENEESGPSAL